MHDIFDEFLNQGKKDERNEDRNTNYKYHLGGIEFEWDTEKNLITIDKHGVSFEEAAEIFLNEDTVFEYDEDHSDYDEERYNAIGYSSKQRALIVCHCYKENEVIRIITARKADKEDIDFYQQNQ